jgi:rubrerythrin
MPEKPTYLGLLNAIACAEGRAHTYLSAWADVTPDPDVRAVLRTVAAREGEHAASFAKRINELGFEVRETDDPNFERQLEIAASDRPDLEKLEATGLLKFHTDGEPDIFDGMFRDHSIDIRTGELLGRYIAEERDTLRLVQGCAAQLEAGASPAPSDDRLASMEDKIDAVCRAVDELRQIVCAQAMPADRV